MGLLFPFITAFCTLFWPPYKVHFILATLQGPLYQNVYVVWPPYKVHFIRMFMLSGHLTRSTLSECLCSFLSLAVFFLLSWAPYTVYSIFQMSGSNWILNPNLVCLPGVFAKSSAVWNPIIYFLRNSEFRKQCIQHSRCLKRFSSERRTSATHYILRRRETEIKLMETTPGKESSL
jgi:hypothetical protein